METKYNPFSPNRTVHTNLFGGRTKYVLDILKKLSGVKNGQTASFYLYGERGIGKTALAKFIKFLSTEKDKQFYNLNFLTSYYTASQSQSLENILEISLNQIANQMDKNIINNISDRVGELFKNGKFTLGLFGAQAGYSYQKDDSKKDEDLINIKDQFVTISSKLLQELRKDNNKNQYDGLIFIIDEMDNITDLDKYASIIRGITTTLDFNDLGNISFMFIGYKEGLDKFIGSDTSIKRHIDQIYLEEMPEKEIVETFEKGFSEANVEWDKDALEDKVYLTGGYPLAIQVIGHKLIDVDLDNRITKEDWDKIVYPCAIEMQEKEYSSFYEFNKSQKTNSEKIVLTLATASYSGIKSISIKDIEKYSKVINPRQYLSTLIKKGTVIYNSGNKDYSIKRGLFSLCIVLDHISSLTNSPDDLGKYLEYISEFKKIRNSNESPDKEANSN